MKYTIKPWDTKHKNPYYSNKYVQLPKLMPGTLLACKETNQTFKIIERHMDKVTITLHIPEHDNNMWYMYNDKKLHVSEVSKFYTVINKKMYKALYG